MVLQLDNVKDVGFFTRTYLGPFNEQNDTGIRSYAWITSLVMRILSCCRICSDIETIGIEDKEGNVKWKYFNKEELKDWTIDHMVDKESIDTSTLLVRQIQIICHRHEKAPSAQPQQNSPKPKLNTSNTATAQTTSQTNTNSKPTHSRRDSDPFDPIPPTIIYPKS